MKRCVERYDYISSAFNVTYFEEYLYTSLRSAKNAVKMISYENRDEHRYKNKEEYYSWQISIVKSSLNCKNIDGYDWDSDREWIYDIYGKLIYDSLKFEQNISINKNINSEKKFEIGDIVIIEPFPWNKHTAISKMMEGVILDLYKNKYIVCVYDKSSNRCFHSHEKKEALKKSSSTDKNIKMISYIIQKDDEKLIEKLCDGEILVTDKMTLKEIMEY